MAGDPRPVPTVTAECLNLMRATVPDLDLKRGGLRSRLAHHVGPLFGLATGTSPAGAVWLSDFNTLTLAEVVRGGPLPTAAWQQQHRLALGGAKFGLGLSPAVAKEEWRVVERALIRGIGGHPPSDEGDPVLSEVHELAPATATRFGPDRKAAMVLVGSNELFGSLMPTIREVVRTVGTLDDGGLLAERMRIAAWAFLVQEAQRSQPALFTAAVQARAVQRALSTGWHPHRIDASLLHARCEFGAEKVPFEGDPDLMPRTLCLLDDSLRDEVRPDLARYGAADRRLLLDDLIALWSRHLLESEGRGFIWVEETSGIRTMHLFRDSLGPVSALLAEVLPLDSRPADAEAASWDTFLPRIPTAGELLKLDRPLSTAVIWTLVQLHRFLRNDPASDVAAMRARVTAEAARVLALSERVLGEDDPLTTWARNRHAVALYQDVRQTDPAAAAEAAQVLTTTVGWLRLHHDTGRIDSGRYVEMLRANTFPLRQHAEDLSTAGRSAESNVVLDLLRGIWSDLFRTVGVDVRAALAETAPGTSDPRLVALAPHVLNYVPLLMKDASREAQRHGLRLLTEYVVPLRRRERADTGADVNLRVALQVAIASIDRYLSPRREDAVLLDGSEAAHWTEAMHGYIAELASLPYVREVEARAIAEPSQPLTNREYASVLRLLTGLVFARERGLDGPDTTDDRLQQLLVVVAAQRGVDLDRIHTDGDRAPRLTSADHSTVRWLAARIEILLSESLDRAWTTYSTQVAPLRDEALLLRSDTETASTIPLEDASLQQALTGRPRADYEPWPTLRLEQVNGHTVLSMTLPVLRAGIDGLEVALETPEGRSPWVALAEDPATAGLARRSANLARVFDPRAVTRVAVRIRDSTP